MVRRISHNSLTDHNGILLTEQTLFRELFKTGDQGEKGFEESRKSFYAWFSSLTGQLTIERAADHIMYYEIDIYNNVSSSIHHNDKTNQELLISLIYDECLFGIGTGYSWHSIVSLKDIFLDNKTLVKIITERWNKRET
ncbi:PapG chaperone-binding domain-containing protein [Paenibacillus sp. YAF4_2]|uniref:PapG chaperone-binding domain-containing protein n=1 Tax=Paenibacillus sp. YAF4_2 TaxID=3233085 RepID=UPI003F99AD08